MSAKDLKELLEHLDDTHEIVLGPVDEPAEALPLPAEELLFCWREAEDEAARAFQLWRGRPGAEAFAVYRAAADRAEAAQATLAAASARPLTRSRP
jgi:acyl-CoA reductase-like NAD-dependent aldehyde dehydrogenase